jgi:hypothetical protein
MLALVASRGISRRRALRWLAGSALAASVLPLLKRGHATAACESPAAKPDYRRVTLRALVATVLPGNAALPGGAEVDLQDVLMGVLDQLEADASLTAAMYLDEFASDVRGRDAAFVCLSGPERDQVLARMCGHTDDSVRALGLFLIAGSLVLFYSEVGAGRVADMKRAGLLPDDASGPWEHTGYHHHKP